MPGSSTTPGRSDLAMVRPKRVAFRARNSVGTRGLAFAAQWLAYALPYRRFVGVQDANARLGADVDRYTFIVVDLHHLLLAGLPAHFESYMASQAVASLWVMLCAYAGQRQRLLAPNRRGVADSCTAAHQGLTRVPPDGHSHQLKIETKNGTLFFNPGSAGPGFRLPITVGRMTAEHGKLRAEIVELSAAVAASVPIAERFAS